MTDIHTAYKTMTEQIEGDMTIESFLDSLQHVLGCGDKGYIACLQQIEKLKEGTLLKFQELEIEELKKENAKLTEEQKIYQATLDEHFVHYDMLKQKYEKLEKEKRSIEKEFHRQRCAHHGFLDPLPPSMDKWPTLEDVTRQNEMDDAPQNDF